ncbi:hypothetical protein [Neisseria lactamica]|uniref:hypothetical protein n=1 Tax=Neisseria lactamica TaxID=486 RepID=UPI0012907021|nr:hypothetical protein [Neisseria lactamica]
MGGFGEIGGLKPTNHSNITNPINSAIYTNSINVAHPAQSHRKPKPPNHAYSPKTFDAVKLVGLVG